MQVRVRTVDITNQRVVASTERLVDAAGPVLIGREGDIAVGVDPVDLGVSRQALELQSDDHGWSITSRNGNGAMLHPWGQASTLLETKQTVHRRWPKIAIRLIGSRTDLHHWVLLEASDYSIEPFRSPADSTNTDLGRPPLPLTEAQLQALRAVFAQHLSWPPVAGPVPVTLQAAARRLGVSDAAIYQRLEAAQNRAYQLGAYRQHGVTDPEYLYVLVRHGYVNSLAPEANGDGDTPVEA